DDALTRPIELANLGELLERVGQRVLLAREPGDEPPAAHEPAVFEAAERPLDVAPREAHRISERDVAEHHTPPVEEELGDGFGELVAVDVGAGRGNEGPAPRRGAGRTGSGQQ